MIITIDGASGTGKSSVAKKLSQQLHIHFFDTGAMYRCFAWILMQKNIALTDTQAIKKELASFTYEQLPESRYLANGQELFLQIRSPEISVFSSAVSTLPFVREKLIVIQRNFAAKQDAIFEGRDMGSVVFADADAQFILSADSIVRAKRRLEHLKKQFPEKHFSLQEAQ